MNERPGGAAGCAERELKEGPSVLGILAVSVVIIGGVALFIYFNRGKE